MNRRPHGLRGGLLFLLTVAASIAAAELPAERKTTRIGPPAAAGRAPKWDARGSGPFPWQGIACVDLAADGSWAAAGTTAPPGDPNVFVFAGDGRPAAQHAAGARWISQVAVADRLGSVLALCTTPQGHAGDRPTVFVLSSDKAKSDSWSKALGNFEPRMFHYGDHSNHLGALLQSGGETAAVVGGNHQFLFPIDSAAAPRESQARCGPESGITAAAIAPGGRTVVGLTAQGRFSAKQGNLVVLEPGRREPLWQRPPCIETDSPRPMEPGRYGPPAPDYEDLKLWAPLAVAIDRSGRTAAAADYQGWERRFLPRGLRRGESYGLRFMPARPMVQVYDDQGNLLRRFGPETFDSPFWCDLAFTAGGKTLLVSPRSWTCRGLAGQAVLPADEGARCLYALDVASGGVQVLEFPDAVSSVSAGGNRVAVACWDGRLYLLDERLRPLAPEGILLGTAGLVRASADGGRIVAAGGDGSLRMFDGDGRLLWRRDLHQLARPGDKPWTRGQKAGQVAPGIWVTNSGRAHSDLGGQYVVEAPQGLLLIDPNAGLSIEQNWARMEGAGLDPRKVRYVLLTHEHGDHAPGAYLWRVLTGAQVVASAETAYTLQRHIPNGTGYGLHPPVPVDVALKEDAELDLAGLKVRGVRLPGHTYGSMGWMFEKGGKQWLAIGDLIMPGGLLGYSGSVNFSPEDVLASLEKIARLKPDAILPGHGPTGDPATYLKGIEVGEATGWGKMAPRKPDPFYGFASRKYLVVGWPEPIQSAAFGDIDGDGRPDVALLTAAPKGARVKVYMNRGGRFDTAADAVVDLPEVEPGFKLRMGRVNGDGVADFLASGESAAVLLLSQGKPAWRAKPLPGVTRASQLLIGDRRQGPAECIVGGRFVGDFHVLAPEAGGRFRPARAIKTTQIYFDLQSLDLNGDGRSDVVTSGGEVFLRHADGNLPDRADLLLPRPGTDWTFMAAADFNGDRRPDVVLLDSEEKGARASVFHHTGEPDRPFSVRPSAQFSVPLPSGMLRDGPSVGDWNGDGIADLVLGAGQSPTAVILLGGSPGGLDPQRTDTVRVDYSLHFDTRLELADFDGDGRTDLAALGVTASGAAGVYIRLR